MDPNVKPMSAPIGPPNAHPKPPPIHFPKLPIKTLFEMILGVQRYKKMYQYANLMLPETK
jgi:hypothetical protein